MTDPHAGIATLDAWLAHCGPYTIVVQQHCYELHGRVLNPAADARPQYIATSPTRFGVLCVEHVAGGSWRVTDIAGHPPLRCGPYRRLELWQVVNAVTLAFDPLFSTWPASANLGAGRKVLLQAQQEGRALPIAKYLLTHYMTTGLVDPERFLNELIEEVERDDQSDITRSIADKLRQQSVPANPNGLPVLAFVCSVAVASLVYRTQNTLRRLKD